ncbi:MAG: methyltransferase regulatory domain-containing protein [Novosphingobium sp.]|nr:methyltransferase regulatory domain-containing protein [Novosphingobium sp.]
MVTSYDRVAYPTALFPRTHPGRMAVAARLAGLEPAPLERARVLEIAGGDCLNLIAFAAAYPHSDCHGFDLAETAIARGQSLIAGAGLGNAHLVVDDILEAHRRYPARSFDYVIAHGIYAWVPPGVREAIMSLIDHVLAERGVAIISYNAMPGGHVRLIMRDMLLEAIGDETEPDARMERARAFLQRYTELPTGDDALRAGLRTYAATMLDRNPAVLFHDELGEEFHPQSLTDVIRAAERSGMRYLSDVAHRRFFDGFLDDDAEGQASTSVEADEQVRHVAQLEDYAVTRFFRYSTFVRREQPIDRRIDPMRIADLWATWDMTRNPDGSFQADKDVIEIQVPEIAERITALTPELPQRIPVRRIAQTIEELRALLVIFGQGYLRLHPDPGPMIALPGERPQTSPLARAMLARGDRLVCRLDHKFLSIEQPDLRALLLAADGTRTLAELQAGEHGIAADQVAAALAAACGKALLCA